MLITGSAIAEHHAAVEEEVHAAVSGFNDAYATNDVEAYFGYYADDATVYFSGARQSIPAYHELWVELIKAGGGVEANEMSDVKVQIMPSGTVAVATSFIDNVTRSPEGEKSVAKAFETDVWQKIDGEWKIVSLHYSEIAPL